MRRVFRDDKLESKFQKEGFALIPFLESTEVQILKDVFFDLLPKSGGIISSTDTGMGSHITYDFTFIDKNEEFKQAVYDKITHYFRPHVETWLDSYRPIIANYIRKQTHDGEVPLHQNWAFVEESRYTSVSIWCPLVDSNEKNGTLQVVPRSHKRFGEIRGPMIPWELESVKSRIIAEDLVPINLPAGYAVVLDDSIIHYSGPNLTSNLRLAIQLILIPAEETSIHYYMDPVNRPGEVDILEVDTDFYMQFNPWKKPTGVKVRSTIQFSPFILSYPQFKKGLKGRRIDEATGKPLLTKLKEIFSD